MFLMFNPLFWIMVGPAFLIALWAQYRVKSTFAKYSRVPSRSGMSGARAAQAIIRAEERVEEIHSDLLKQLQIDAFNFLAQALNLPRQGLARLRQHNERSAEIIRVALFSDQAVGFQILDPEAHKLV